MEMSTQATTRRGRFVKTIFAVVTARGGNKLERFQMFNIFQSSPIFATKLEVYHSGAHQSASLTTKTASLPCKCKTRFDNFYIVKRTSLPQTTVKKFTAPIFVPSKAWSTFFR